MTAHLNCMACDRSRIEEAAGRQVVLCRTDTGLVVVASFGRKVSLRFLVVTPGDECPEREGAT